MASSSSSDEQLSSDERDEENKGITNVIKQEMKISSLCDLYIIFAGATVEVASTIYSDCKWYGIQYGRLPSSIRVFSIQDYSVLLRHLDMEFTKYSNKMCIEDKKDEEEVEKQCNLVKSINVFANIHLRPLLVGDRCMLEQQWFHKQEYAYCIDPVLHEIPIHEREIAQMTSSERTIQALSGVMSSVLRIWAVKMGFQTTSSNSEYKIHAKDNNSFIIIPNQT